MMNDLRDAPYTVETKTNEKIIAAFVVAFGVCAIAAYGYESGTWSSAPAHVVASNAAASNAVASNTAPPEPLASTAATDPLPQPIADVASASEKDAAQHASPQDVSTPTVKVARAQAPAPVLRQAPAASSSAQQSSEVIKPAAEPVPQQPASQSADITPAASTAPQEEQAQARIEPQAEAAPAPQPESNP